MDITTLMEYAQSENILLAEIAIDRLKEFKGKKHAEHHQPVSHVVILHALCILQV